MKAPALLFLSAVLASCAIDDGMPNFERMSAEELAAYNEGRNLSQMIICQEVYLNHESGSPQALRHHRSAVWNRHHC